jgi:hypothetical protein
MKISTGARAVSLLLAVMTSALVIGGTLVGITDGGDQAAVIAMERATKDASKAG